MGNYREAKSGQESQSRAVMSPRAEHWYTTREAVSPQPTAQERVRAVLSAFRQARPR